MFKKLLLTLFSLFICSIAHATTWYACSGGGNWNGATTWTSVQIDQVGCIGALGNPVAGDTATLNSSSGNVTISAAAAAATIDETGYTGTLAFGTQTLTLTAASNLTGAMTSTSGTISTSGNITLLATPTGSFPIIKITGANTLTSGGFTWPGTLNLNVAGNVVLSGNWINTGLVTYSSTTFLNSTTSETFTVNGGLTMAANGGAGTATIIAGGGTISSTGTGSGLKNNLIFQGNSTIGLTLALSAQTTKYVSGSVTVTGSTVVLNGATTFNINGMTLNNLFLSGTIPITLSSNLTILGTLLNTVNVGTDAGGSLTFSGAFNISVGTLTFNNNTGSQMVLTIPAGQTLTVTNAINTYGMTAFTTLIKSDTSSSSAFLNYTGTPANEDISRASFTDIDASGSSQTLYDWFAGTLTRTNKIVSVTAANIGGLFIQ